MVAPRIDLRIYLILFVLPIFGNLKAVLSHHKEATLCDLALSTPYAGRLSSPLAPMSLRQRPPSPSNTTFSGISNYKSESFRTINRPPAVPAIDARKIARIHFEEIQIFLGELAKGCYLSMSRWTTRLTSVYIVIQNRSVHGQVPARN